MTPEKLQGVTLYKRMYIGALDRLLFQAACLYVAFSRVLTMDSIVLSELLTMEYVNKFHPPIIVLLKMRELLDLLDFPPYASPEQRREMDEWVEAEK